MKVASIVRYQFKPKFLLKSKYHVRAVSTDPVPRLPNSFSIQFSQWSVLELLLSIREGVE